ncbi:MAG: GntR family transcriptional regulator [Fusobacteriaceae bacterium]
MINRIKENSRGHVYKALKNKIMCLELLPGQSISESDLANALGVSRTPIRETLVRLIAENLIEVYPQRGTFISKINLEFVEEGFEVRKLIEKDVLKCAIFNIQEKDLKSLYKNLYLQKGNIELEGDVKERFALDNDFHEQIYKVAKRRVTWEGIQNICTHYDRVRFLDAVMNFKKNKTIQQHNEIYEILKNKDLSKIDNIVEEHLSNFKEKIDVFKIKYPEYFK